MRCCCPSPCRGYIANLQAEYNRKVIFCLQRESKCSLGPFARPVGYLVVTGKNGQGLPIEDIDDTDAALLNEKSAETPKFNKNYIGKIELPFNLFRYQALIYGHD